ncbi:MAG: hypothetical protein U0Q11_24020 [Vicinamibacterales bacterium]
MFPSARAIRWMVDTARAVLRDAAASVHDQDGLGKIGVVDDGELRFGLVRR